MDCNYTTIKTCELKGSTFRSHVLNFGDFDISDYEFATDFANTLGHKVAEQTLDKFGNTVVLPLTVLEGKSGNIRADVWMTKDDVRDLAVRFEIAISSDCTGSSDTTEHDITVTFEELVIPVTVTQAVVNINLDWESLTPEQKAELVGPAGPQGPEGPQGIQGPQGETGPKGDTGERGLQGERGLKGDTGEQGEQGPKGDKGDKGDVGEKGDKGDKGDVGIQGIQGPKGDKGDTGEQGIQGIQGIAGNNGWQPLLVADTTTIAGKTLLKLSDWIGGTGTKPTTNVGQWQKADGTYTSIASEAIDFTATFATRIASLENIVQNNTWYGVEWDLTVSNPIMTRIGNTALHQSLPIQSKMRRCLLKDDGSVNYYLDANDSTKKADGTAANLTGVDGQVMVEVPKHYRRFDTEGNKVRCLISENQLPDFHEVPLMYISAYQATVDRTIPATPKLASVVNTTANFRGGNNNAAWDAESRTLLGKPASTISLTNFRTYARNRGNAGRNGAGWNCYLYEANKAMFWLYMVEYANRNSQATFNAANDSNGFKQGGLGNGVTDVNAGKWGTFNGSNPFIPMGQTNSLGNKTGIVGYTMPAEYDVVPFTTYVPSYRGIENPFGHIMQWVDGIKVRMQADSAGGRSVLYISKDPSKFQDTDYKDYTESGDLARTDTYIKRLTMGEFGEITQAEGGGGSTTYWTDQSNGAIPPTGEVLRGVMCGGVGYFGAISGLAFSDISQVPSYAFSRTGSRLCFLP